MKLAYRGALDAIARKEGAAAEFSNLEEALVSSQVEIIEFMSKYE